MQISTKTFEGFHLGHHQVHRDVFGGDGKVLENLLLERQPHPAAAVRPRLERRVVIAAAAPQSLAVPTEAEAGNDEHVYLIDGNELGAGRRLPDSQSPR